MCGICGYALSGGSRPIDGTVLDAMRDSMAYRGPDSCGRIVGERFGVGHRRLSIVDVGGGHQPMSSDDGSLHIVYNGEVYNHLELRRMLEGRGHQYRTTCDTETVLRLYEEDGPAAVRKLRGMFAFGVWDDDRGELFLARDRLGIKPLYYVHTDEGSLYFASEIKALLAMEKFRPELNMNSLPDYLANHAPSGAETLFAGIRRLPPAHTLRWFNGEVELRRYWDVAHETGVNRRPDSELIRSFAELFRESVRIRLMADVPLGAFLSGGIDSTVITGVMSELVREPVKTFSVAFADREANELEYARLAARTFGTEHHEVMLGPERFFQLLPAMIWHEDEPLAHPSSIPLHAVAELASEHVKVVLTGEGSDELLGGYGRYWKTLYNVKLGQSFQRFTGTRLRRGIRTAIQRLPAGSARSKLLRTFLSIPPDLQSIYFDNFAVFSRSRQADLLTPEARDRIADSADGGDPYVNMQAFLDRTTSGSMLQRLLYVDLHGYLQELLMKQDQMSMAASVESRVPFLDHRLVEFAAALPDHMKLRGRTTKYILRRAFADLVPERILNRSKAGFPVPLATWLRGPYRHVVDEYVLHPRVKERGIFDPENLRVLVAEHDSGKFDHSERLWSLINFEHWYRMYIEAESFTRSAMPELRAGVH